MFHLHIHLPTGVLSSASAAPTQQAHAQLSGEARPLQHTHDAPHVTGALTTGAMKSGALMAPAHLAGGGAAKPAATAGALPRMSMNDASSVSAALAQLGITMPAAPQFAMWSPVATATYGSFGAPQLQQSAPATTGVAGVKGV